MKTLRCALAGACLLAACAGETAGEVVPVVVGVRSVPDGDRALGELDTKTGWHVKLDEASFALAALYAYAPEQKSSAMAQLMDLIVPVARAHGGFDPLTGRPVRAELVDVYAIDLLDDSLQELSEVAAESGHVVNTAIELAGPADSNDETLHGHSFWVSGVATRAEQSVRFEGGFDVPDEGLKRRVESIETDAKLAAGMTLVLDVHLRSWFDEAQFDRLAPAQDGEPSAITSDDQVGRAWFIGARSPNAFSVKTVAQGDKP